MGTLAVETKTLPGTYGIKRVPQWSHIGCFVFVFLLSLKPRLFVQLFFVLRYACAPTDTRTNLTTVCVLFSFCFLPFFVSLEISLFPSFFVPLLPFFFLSVEYLRFLRPNDVFIPYDHGLDFWHQFM